MASCVLFARIITSNGTKNTRHVCVYERHTKFVSINLDLQKELCREENIKIYRKEGDWVDESWLLQQVADFVECSGALKLRALSWGAKRQLASEKGICSM